MEYIEGKDLKAIIAEQISYSTQKKVEILSNIARALHYAHQRGVLHRDVKPANIMLINDSPKITDFGIARVMEISGDQTLLEVQEGLVMKKVAHGNRARDGPRDQIKGGAEVCADNVGGCTALPYIFAGP